MRSLCEEFKYFRGQPVEIITEGIKFCGIDIDSDDDEVEIIDECNRIVLIPFRHIDAVIEPKMKLTRFCGENDCRCEEEEEEVEEEKDCGHECRRKRDDWDD